MGDFTVVKENVDYELIPSDTNWHVRILQGDFVETVYEYGPLVVSEDGEHIKFSAKVISSPCFDDIDDDNIEWHDVTGSILSDIMERALPKNEFGTNNSQEHSN